MSQIEQLECTVAILVRRIETLERLRKADSLHNADTADALSKVRELGLDGDTLVNAIRIPSRQRLARELRLAGWSGERIGKVMSCSEKTVRRWVDAG